MRWETRRRSQNVEDRRGSRGLLVGGGVGTLIIALLAFFLGGDPGSVLGVRAAPRQEGELSEDERALGEFASTVLASTEDVWHELFRASGSDYREPTLVLFADATQSACGFAQAAVGPFYCPNDGRVYLDLAFFDDLSQRFRAPGDFAQAYVIAHEVGHHVQNLLGTLGEAHARQAELDEVDANRLSVAVELQADFYAGVWGHHAAQQGLLEPDDIEEGLRAASAIGDDRLQRQSQGYVVPDSFTHGSSEQRLTWFRRGLESGDPSQGDTFTAQDL
jgi:predicted metalloprotease